MNEEIIRMQIQALESHAQALKEVTAALREKAEAERQLENTIRLILEDKDGNIDRAADAKLYNLSMFAEQMRESANIMRAAAADFDEASRRVQY